MRNACVRAICRPVIVVISCLYACLAGFAATEYEEDGAPGSRGECQRWYMNRARFHPEMEADRLGITNSEAGGHPDYDIGEGIAGGTNAWAALKFTRGPLAPNDILIWTAYLHASDMANMYWMYGGNPRDYVSHYSPNDWYYNPGWSPCGYFWAGSSFGERMQQLGLYPSYAGENLSWYTWTVSAEYVYEALFRDYDVPGRGHRTDYLDAMHRETGIDWYRLADAWDYDVTDFCTRNGYRFFTDTIFNDADGDDMYDEGEGVGGIEVRLWTNGVESAWFDRSQGCGSFAIPLSDSSNGKTVSVQLVNPGAVPVTLSIPRNFTEVAEVTVGASNSVLYSTFVQTNTLPNVGFRHTSPIINIGGAAMADTNATIRFEVPVGFTYNVQSSDSLSTPNWITFDTLLSSNNLVTVLDYGQSNRLAPSEVSARFYRLQLSRNDQSY